MAEVFTFYSDSFDSITEEGWMNLAPGAAPTFDDNGNVRYQFTDVKVECEILPEEELKQHLQEISQQIFQVYKGELDDRGRLMVERVLRTLMVVRVTVDPRRDEKEKVAKLMENLGTLVEAIVFCNGHILNDMGQLLLAPDGSFDPEAAMLMGQEDVKD